MWMGERCVINANEWFSRVRIFLFQQTYPRPLKCRPSDNFPWRKWCTHTHTPQADNEGKKKTRSHASLPVVVAASANPVETTLRQRRSSAQPDDTLSHAHRSSSSGSVAASASPSATTAPDRDPYCTTATTPPDDLSLFVRRGGCRVSSVLDGRRRCGRFRCGLCAAVFGGHAFADVRADDRCRRWWWWSGAGAASASGDSVVVSATIAASAVHRHWHDANTSVCRGFGCECDTTAAALRSDSVSSVVSAARAVSAA